MNETALKERLRVIGKEKGITFNEVWKQLLLERFLSRLSRSENHDKFIFKGGLLLSQYISIGRETTDADFLMKKVKSEIPAIESAFLEIISTKVNDGFTFEWNKIEELTQPHMDYPGYRITLATKLGKMKDKIQIDVGVGDVVDPIENDFHPFEYRGKPIFEGEITLLAYPVETILAEKLETIISKGAINSRMKDYHDVILIIREDGLIDSKKLKKTVPTTFVHRQTAMKFPISFDAQGRESLERLWSNHLNRLGKFKQTLGLPETIELVLQEINGWMAQQGLIS